MLNNNIRSNSIHALSLLCSYLIWLLISLSESQDQNNRHFKIQFYANKLANVSVEVKTRLLFINSPINKQLIFRPWDRWYLYIFCVYLLLVLTITNACVFLSINNLCLTVHYFEIINWNNSLMFFVCLHSFLCFFCVFYCHDLKYEHCFSFFSIKVIYTHEHILYIISYYAVELTE